MYFEGCIGEFDQSKNKTKHEYVYKKVIYVFESLSCKTKTYRIRKS